MQSNEILVSAAKAGDDASLTELLIRFEPIVRMRVNCLSAVASDREDLFQEGMITLLSAIRRFDPAVGASFRTFAVTCIDNRIKTLSYAAKKEIAGTRISFEDIPADQIDGSVYANPEDTVIDKEQTEKFRNIAEQNLSDFEKKVFSLYIAGFSYKSMSKILDKSGKSIDNAVCRIKRKLHGSFREL